jgi:hypothetical protein
MPSRSCQEGDTVFVRATVLLAGDGFFQVLIDDGVALSITTWVPSRECAKHEDISELRPIRRRRGFIDR